jgi:hypothetical protein
MIIPHVLLPERASKSKKELNNALSLVGKRSTMVVISRLINN